MHGVQPHAAHPLPLPPEPSPDLVPPGGRSFQAVLRSPTAAPPGSVPAAQKTAAGPLGHDRGSAVPPELVDVITQLRRDERTLDRHLKRALAGHDFDMPRLVALQSLAFRYSQRVELLGKLVDRLTGAVKQTLQMQV